MLLLHPPSESRPSTPEVQGAASGCVLLPGVPHLGLEHRAAWVEAERDGTVTRLVSKVGVDPAQDPDTAVLAMLLTTLLAFVLGLYAASHHRRGGDVGIMVASQVGIAVPVR